MFYSHNPILETPAEAIVVPVTLSGRPAAGSLQALMIARFGPDYTDDFREDVKLHRLRPGTPSVYIPPKVDACDKAIINFPMPDRSEIMVLSDVVTELRELFALLKNWNLPSVAIPHLGPDYKWETLENIILRMEGNVAAEIWLYPPEEVEEDVEEPEVLTCNS